MTDFLFSGREAWANFLSPSVCCHDRELLPGEGERESKGERDEERGRGRQKEKERVSERRREKDGGRERESWMERPAGGGGTETISDEHVPPPAGVVRQAPPVEVSRYVHE